MHDKETKRARVIKLLPRAKLDRLLSGRAERQSHLMTRPYVEEAVLAGWSPQTTHDVLIYIEELLK